MLPLVICISVGIVSQFSSAILCIMAKTKTSSKQNDKLLVKERAILWKSSWAKMAVM